MYVESPWNEEKNALKLVALFLIGVDLWCLQLFPTEIQKFRNEIFEHFFVSLLGIGHKGQRNMQRKVCSPY